MLQSTTKSVSPYLSVVVCSRNDDHGGKLIQRMQAFVDGLAEQSKRYGIALELVLVEWNPPTDRSRLASVLHWPSTGDYFQARIIEVPPWLHHRFRHSDELPLFQMIAKNVGIRAARGDFVLATNIDILFSDELIGSLAKKPLRKGKYYRADRYDVPSDVPEKGSIEAELAYCRENVLRICSKNYVLDCKTGQLFRIYPDSKGFRQIQGLLWAAGPLIVFDFARRRYGRQFRELRSQRRSSPRVPRVKKGFLGTWRHLREERLNLGSRIPEATFLRYLDLLESRIESLPIWNGRIGNGKVKTRARFLARSRASQILIDLMTLPPPSRPWLFTNASGDFTLMSKADWVRLRGYPEFEMFSMHIDSILLYNAYYSGLQESYIGDPIYHIDHAKGWSPSFMNPGGLNEEMTKKKVPVLSYEDFLVVTSPMVRNKRGILFNGENWGLGDQRLPEFSPQTEAIQVPSSSLTRGSA